MKKIGAALSAISLLGLSAFAAADNAVPATGEVQLGRMFSPSFGVYVDGLFGIGADKPYEWGVGVGVRFNY